jgi:hypothetical protein
MPRAQVKDREATGTSQSGEDGRSTMSEHHLVDALGSH